jgi:regulator of RNase E activity RraA
VSGAVKGGIMAQLWDGDAELFALAKAELFTAVVGDVMDQLGFLQQFLPPQIRPLDPGMVVVGRAMPVVGTDSVAATPWFGVEGSQAQADAADSPTRKSGNPVISKPFGLMLEALDDLKPNEVYLSTGGSPRYAVWGELMSTRAMKLGSAGAVLAGYTRDTNGILELGFPTFAIGSYAQDQSPRGKVVDFRCAVEIAGVRVDPGDIVFGDIDGVCVVPRKAEREVFVKAIEKARGEKQVQEAIGNGMSAQEAFDRFGIL